MNGYSLQWSNEQTEVPLKAFTAGSVRMLITISHIFGQVEISRKFLFVMKIRLNFTSENHWNSFFA